MQFPSVTGKNLQRKQLSLPDEFAGDLNIVLVAFQQWQQDLIDTWLPFVEKLEQNYAGVSYYELPVIRKMNLFSRAFINEGMRTGIPGLKARERTITLYLDKVAFRQALGMPHEQDIYVLLLDQQGRVLWKTEGEFTSEQGESLRACLENVIE